MNEQLILDLVEKGESGAREFKRNFDKDALEAITAFANTKGGILLVGVEDDGHISRASISKETIQNWINQVKLSTTPSIIPDMEVVEVGNKKVVFVKVMEYPIKPVALRGKYIKRVKNSNHHMDISEVTDLHLKTFNTSWDYYIDNHHSVEDISLDKVRDFIELANKYKDIKITDDPVRLLNKFELIRENKISYGGFLLFMKGASAFTTISIVKIFDDRIEIYNPGKLPEGLSVEKLLPGDYISTIRNKKVAEIFKEANIIENYGSGILRILEGFAAHGLQAPKFEEIGIGFRVTVFKETAKNDRLNDRIKEKTPRYNEKVAVKTEEKERILLQKIRENPLITAEELSGILNINERNTRRYLAKLKEEGKIKRVGSRKNGTWQVIED